MKNTIFIALVFTTLGLISCREASPEIVPATVTTVDTPKTTPIPPSVDEPSNISIRIAGKNVAIGEYFYPDESMNIFRDHGIKLLWFDTKTHEMTIEYSSVYGTRGEEICTWRESPLRTITYRIPSKEEFDSGVNEACIMKNVCGPTWRFCFISTDSPTHIEIVSPQWAWVDTLE